MQSYQRQILCAESHQDTGWFLVTWLGLAGYEVTLTDTAAGCIRLAATRHSDLYLIAGQFADGTGFDLAEKIRSFDRQTPLIFYSAHAYPADIERGMKIGAQAYLTKPSDPEELLRTIRLLIKAEDGQVLRAT